MMLSGWGFKGENFGKGRWTQTQLHRRQDRGNKRRAFIKQKLNAKKKPKTDKMGFQTGIMSDADKTMVFIMTFTVYIYIYTRFYI